MITKLDAIFGIYNKVDKLNIELYNPNFAIDIKDKKESFEIFYIRFSAAIALLNYLDILKISNLKRLVSARLRYRILDKNFSLF